MFNYNLNNQDAIEEVIAMAHEKFRVSQDDAAEAMGMMRATISNNIIVFSADPECQQSFEKGFNAVKKFLAAQKEKK